MLKLNNKEINFKRTLSKAIKDHRMTNGRDVEISDFEGDATELYKYFDLNEAYFSLKFLVHIANMIASGNFIDTYFIKYINMCGEDNFCEIRWDKYLARENRNVANTPEYFQLVYGDGWEDEISKQKARRCNMYSPEYVMKRDNVCYDVAVESINNLKKEKATSKENFIKKHGIGDGVKLFEKFQDSSKHTEDKFTIEYGISQGKQKWLDYVERKRFTSVRCIDHWVNKGYDLEQARIELMKFQLLSSPIHKEYWLAKGYSTEETEAKVAQYDKDSGSVSFFKKKYGDDWQQEYKLNQKKKSIAIGLASKQSLIYFTTIHSRLMEIGIPDDDIKYGIANKMEKCIIYFDTIKMKERVFLYDFCIENKNIIIEFHGHKYHPNPNMSTTDWLAWRHLKKTHLDAKVVYEQDNKKGKVALDNGFKYLSIYSDDDQQQNWDKIYNFLEENQLKIN